MIRSCVSIIKQFNKDFFLLFSMLSLITQVSNLNISPCNCTPLFLLKTEESFKILNKLPTSLVLGTKGSRTVPRRTFPRRTFPRRSVPRRHLLDGHFPDGQFPERAIPLTDIFPTDSSRMTFPRTDVSPNHIFSLFKSLFTVGI